MHEVVPSAVRKAVRAATITFTATSINRFFFIRYFLLQPSAISLQSSLFTIHYSLFTRKEAPCGALFTP